MHKSIYIDPYLRGLASVLHLTIRQIATEENARAPTTTKIMIAFPKPNPLEFGKFVVTAESAENIKRGTAITTIIVCH
jgi:hypothetical protein